MSFKDQIIGHRVEPQCLHPERRGTRHRTTSEQKHFQSTRYLDGRSNPGPNHMMQRCPLEMQVQTEPFSRFIPPHQTHADNFASSSSEDSQHFNQTTVFNVQTNKTTGAGQPRNTGMQTSPSKPAPTGITGAMQMSPNRISQMGGMQTYTTTIT